MKKLFSRTISWVKRQCHSLYWWLRDLKTRLKLLWMIMLMLGSIIFILTMAGGIVYVMVRDIRSRCQMEAHFEEIVLSTDKTSSGLEVVKFVYHNHEYLLMRNLSCSEFDFHRQVIHNPDCPCGRKDEKGDL